MKETIKKSIFWAFICSPIIGIILITISTFSPMFGLPLHDAHMVCYALILISLFTDIVDVTLRIISDQKEIYREKVIREYEWRAAEEEREAVHRLCETYGFGGNENE